MHKNCGTDVFLDYFVGYRYLPVLYVYGSDGTISNQQLRLGMQGYKSNKSLFISYLTSNLFKL